MLLSLNRYFSGPSRLNRNGILLPKYARIKRILRSFFILTAFWTAYSHALDPRYAQAKTPSFPDIKSAVDYLRELGVEVPAVQTAEKVFVGRFINGARRIYCEPLATNFQNNLISAFGSEKVYAVDLEPEIPMIMGEYKKGLKNQAAISLRIKIGSFSTKNNNQVHNFISPWISISKLKLSNFEASCLIETKLGSGAQVRLPVGRELRAGPSRDATIVGSTDDRKMRLIGATTEKDLRWWIFGDYDPVTKKNVNYYAKNIAQFTYGDNFRRSSEECSSFVDEPTTMAMLKSNRRMLKKGFTKKITNIGFHSVSQLSGFGVTVFELCQELQGNVINFNLNYKLNNTKSAEISKEIEYKMEYAGKVEVFDISGEIDNMSLDFLNTIRSELINF